MQKPLHQHSLMHILNRDASCIRNMNKDHSVFLIVLKVKYVFWYSTSHRCIMQT